MLDSQTADSGTTSFFVRVQDSKETNLQLLFLKEKLL